MIKLKKDRELLVIGWVILLSFFASSIEADEIVHKFKSPSFSGVGQSSHYLTIENQEKSRRDKLAADVEDRIAKAERDAKNTTLAKFLRNVESRIYAQIAKQLVENMFNNEEGADYGTFTIEGNTVTYERMTGEDGADFIRLTIVASDGTTTTLDIPVGTGGF
jgi:CO dehydrogenase/acetyl-CoA synthase beta subunit